MKRYLFLLPFLFAPSLANAQGSVAQYGVVTQGNFAAWRQNGIIYDSGVNSITLDFPTVANGHLIGNATGSSAQAQDTSLTALMDTLCGAAVQGQILYRGSSSWSCLAAGTSGQFLKTLGAGSNPAWDTPTGTSYSAGTGLSLSLGVFSLQTPVSVANGGTGLTTGTSGGIPYFSGSTSMGTSGALGEFKVVIGGGAGVAPYTLGSAGTSGQVLTSNGASADPSWVTPNAGTVTSVALTMPSVFSVAGSPITASGTLAVTANGTSGGVPYFNASNTMASSAALTANLPVIGGGAGAAPTVGTRSGNTTKFVTATGSFTTGNCLKADSSGNAVDGTTPCNGLTGTSASIGGGSVSTDTCTSGTASVTGATTSMAVVATPGTYPGDGFVWKAYVSSADTVTVKVCNYTAGSLTPTASTYIVRVLN